MKITVGTYEKTFDELMHKYYDLDNSELDNHFFKDQIKKVSDTAKLKYYNEMRGYASCPLNSTHNIERNLYYKINSSKELRQSHIDYLIGVMDGLGFNKEMD